MTSEIKDQKINWDNSYIGEIDLLVTQAIEDKKYILIDLKCDTDTDEKAILYNFESFVPLICEDFKDLFNLKKTGKHIVKYKHKHMLMVRFKTQANLRDYLKLNNINPRTVPDYLKEDIQKYIAFRYIFSLKTINETTLSIVFNSIFTPYIVSTFENELNYRVKLSQRIIDDWFDDIEHFHKVVKSMIGDRDVTLLKFQIQKIIEKYDKSLIGWTNVIYNRLLLESNII
jgi:hypothetical protein